MQWNPNCDKITVGGNRRDFSRPEVRKMISALQKSIFSVKNYVRSADTKLIYSIYIPIFIDNFMTFMISMIHMTMVSGLGEEAMSGVGLVGQMNAFITAVAITGISSGVTVIVSQYVGAKDACGASHSAGQGILVSALLSIAVAAVLIAFPRQVFLLCYGKAEESVVANAVTYLVPLSVSLPAFAVYQAAFSISRANGDNRFCLIIAVVLNLLNLFAAYVLIYICDMGIFGAGLGYVISRTAAAVYCLYYLRKKEYLEKFAHIFTVSLHYMWNILKIGFIMGFENMLFNFGKTLTTGVVVAAGTVHVAANTAVTSVFNVLTTPYVAGSTVSLTLVGRYIGADEKEEARAIAWKVFFFVFRWQAFMCLAVAPFSRQIIGFFAQNPEVISLSLTLLYINLITMPFFGPMVGPALQSLSGAGDNIFKAAVSVTSMWVLRIGLCYVLAGGYFPVFEPIRGVIGVWIAQTIDLFVKGGIMTARTYGRKWLNKKIV